MREAHQQDVDAQPKNTPAERRLPPIKPLTSDDLSEVEPLGLNEQTPLLYYILRESEIREGGKRLGPVGGRIVAEVFIGLLRGDSQSYLSAAPRWIPNLNGGRDFAMADLLRLAGVANVHAAGPPANTTWQPA
jgi:hypothetical protein